MVREIVKWFQTWPSKPLAWISYRDLKTKPKKKGQIMTALIQRLMCYNYHATSCVVYLVLVLLFWCFKHYIHGIRKSVGHLVCDVNGKFVSLSSLFSCFSWNCGIDCLWRFGGERSLDYKEWTLVQGKWSLKMGWEINVADIFF